MLLDLDLALNEVVSEETLNLLGLHILGNVVDKAEELDRGLA